MQKFVFAMNFIIELRIENCLTIIYGFIKLKEINIEENN